MAYYMIMLRKSLLILTVALGLTMSAQANLGEGCKAAAQRWGKPLHSKLISRMGSLFSYDSNGWYIEQLYDAHGCAQAVRYYKQGSTPEATNFLTKEEKDALWLANVGGESKSVHWTYLPESTNAQQMWYCPDYGTVHLEMVLIDKVWVNCMIFATLEGTKLIAAQIAQEPDSPASASNDPTKQSI